MGGLLTRGGGGGAVFLTILYEFSALVCQRCA